MIQFRQQIIIGHIKMSGSKIHDIRTKIVDPVTLLPHTIDLVQLKKFAKGVLGKVCQF